MPLSEEELAYLEAHPMRRLTFNGQADLYQSIAHGAVTIERAMELDEIHRQYGSRRIQPQTALVDAMPESDELASRRERLVDEYEEGLSLRPRGG